MGGGGKGGGGGATVPEEARRAAETLQNIGREQLDLGIPLLEQGGQDALNVLEGGIPESLRPAILNALEQGRSQASAGLVSAREAATRQGLTGTALQDALAGQRQAAETQVAGIPSAFLDPVLQGATGQVFGLPSAGLQSLGSAASAGANAAIPGRQSGGLAGGLGGAASGAATGAQIGSIFPGYGTAIGAVIGGLGGAAKGAQ